tara:strand:+ start:16082 stop:17056 length:975 start_codon:yes stop_codon:yes gene_type:complete
MKDYNFLNKFLHNLILPNKIIKKSLFELEKKFILKGNDCSKGDHIFITGLPRSGTTYLLNEIFKTNIFASLQYYNLPFITSPTISEYFKRYNKVGLRERYHKDKIFINDMSPEAFDEIFFRLYNQDELQKELVNYIRLLLKVKKKNRYLSKNNNNYKRIEFINKIFPNAKFLFVVRNPAHHAFSLFNQHRNFCEIQKKNNFAKKYMSYLGHDEFGYTHKPWVLPRKFLNKLDINYWLEQWLLFYQKNLPEIKKNKNAITVSYENLQNYSFQSHLRKFLGINTEFMKNFESKNKNLNELKLNYDKKLLKFSLNFYKDKIENQNQY